MARVVASVFMRLARRTPLSNFPDLTIPASVLAPGACGHEDHHFANGADGGRLRIGLPFDLFEGAGIRRVAPLDVDRALGRRPSNRGFERLGGVRAGFVLLGQRGWLLCGEWGWM